jgi:hypothetical protein
MRRSLCISLSRGSLAAIAGLTVVGATAAVVACSSSTGSGFQGLGTPDAPKGFVPVDGSTGPGDTGTTNHDSGVLMMHDAGLPPPDGSVTMTSVTTIYAHTDTELYKMDPMTNALTDVGTFTGTSGGYYDGTVTDLAVDAAGEVYVNTEQVIYKATLPTTLPGPVQLTSVLNTDPSLPDGGTLAVKYYALAFAPAGAIGVPSIASGETLVGGDSNGELWVIPSSGAAIDVGNFGADPNNASNFLSLSGDLVFYTSGGQPTGLATIRTCSKSSSGKVTCTKTNDYLAAINMANLKANATSPTSSPASLLGGIYGGTTTADGNGTGKAELFGLGAWGSNVYGFARCYECYDGGVNTPASLVQIGTTAGAGQGVATPVSGTSFPFTNGWSGAGVTTTVTVTVVAPPMTAPPK